MAKVNFGDVVAAGETNGIESESKKAVRGKMKKDKTEKRKYTRRAPLKEKTKTKAPKSAKGFVTIQVPAEFAFHIGVMLGSSDVK